MIDYEIRFKTQSVGEHKGETVYYAHPKTQQKMTHKEVVDRIVRETSLSEGDVSNALISLKNVVCEALKAGNSIDLADLGSLRVTQTSKMVDSPDKLSKDSLNSPKIVFTPKQAMRNAANAVEANIDYSRVLPAKSKTPGTGTPGGGSGNTGGSGNEGGSGSDFD